MSAETAPVTPIEKLAESADVQVRIERQRASLRKAAPLFAIFGAALLVLACYLTKATARLEAGGVRATGTVVGLHLESSSNSSTYHALVRFTDLSGTDIQFKDSVGSNPPSHRAGDTVTVLYLPGDAQRSATVDRGVWNWIGPVAAGAFGLLLVTLAVRGWRRPRQSSPSQAALNH